MAKPSRRGRPRKRPSQERIFGMTLRIPASYRIALRRCAEADTDASDKIVSIHDLILEMIEFHLRVRGADI